MSQPKYFLHNINTFTLQTHIYMGIFWQTKKYESRKKCNFMISEDSSIKPGVLLCQPYCFLLWNWKSMSFAVLVCIWFFYVWFKLEHYVCTTPAKPNLPRVIQKSLTINNSDGGMRNVFMYWKNKFPRLFAKILPYLGVWHVVSNILQLHTDHAILCM